jgi:hypothetical protein
LEKFNEHEDQVEIIVPRGQSETDVMILYEKVRLARDGICSPFLNFLLGRVGGKDQDG